MGVMLISRPRRLFQFTPLREGRLQVFCIPTEEMTISIHAPPRGATPCRQRFKCSLDDFNSRPSARGDAADMASFYNLDHISIHAPPRGATTSDFANIERKIISIHAPPRGATALALNYGGGKTFQFTPLREGRRRLPPSCPSRTYFNSRPSARGDVGICGNGTVPRPISIHAPPRGATYCVGWKNNRKSISIHAPPRGATRKTFGYHYYKIFQFTPLREGRLRALKKGCRTSRFQFTPLREGRRCGG